MDNKHAEIEINRAAKFFLDNGEVESPEAAEKRLNEAAIVVSVGPEVRTNRNVQAALMTVVNAGARTFLGGVHVIGPLEDCPVLADIPGPKHLARAIEFYGGRRSEPPNGAPYLVIGNGVVPEVYGGPVLRITWKEWCACVTSEVAAYRLDDDDSFPPAAIHAASKALAECFQYFFLKNPMATRRTWVTSLYRPDFKQNPLDMAGPADPLLLPSKFWLIGLGHLGQAYLWNLLWLRYPIDQRPAVVLQDIDEISRATLSTGMLAFHGFLGQLKTRVLCRFLEGAGWTVRLVERPFDAKLVVRDEEPQRALSGLDSQEDRAVLDKVGFHEVIDAGLGFSASGFMNYQVRVFPAVTSAAEIFKRDPNAQTQMTEVERLKGQPGYKHLEQKIGCGMIEVAQKAVGAPFVGTAVASIVISEAVRASMPGSARYHGLSGSLSGPEALESQVRLNPPCDNLGFIRSL